MATFSINGRSESNEQGTHEVKEYSAILYFAFKLMMPRGDQQRLCHYQ